MAFFEDVDELRIVENHIQQLLALEESESKRLLKRYRQIRQEMRDRLDRIPEGTFTAQRLRGAIIQVESGILEMSRALNEEMSESAQRAAEMGINDLKREIRTFSKEFTGAIVPINVDAVAVATQTKNFLVNRYESSISSYSQALRNQMTMSLTNSAIEEVSLSEVVRRIGRFFQGEEWKIQRLARTELHNVYNVGKLNGMREIREESVPSLKKTLIHPMDSRTADDSKQLARKNPIVDVDKPFRFTFKRNTKEGIVEEERVFMSPPDRPNDRAILVPYMPEWES